MLKYFILCSLVLSAQIVCANETKIVQGEVFVSSKIVTIGDYDIATNAQFLSEFLKVCNLGDFCEVNATVSGSKEILSISSVKKIENIQEDKKVSQAANNRNASELLFKLFSFGMKKEEVFDLLKNKGFQTWTRSEVVYLGIKDMPRRYDYQFVNNEDSLLVSYGAVGIEVFCSEDPNCQRDGIYVLHFDNNMELYSVTKHFSSPATREDIAAALKEKYRTRTVKNPRGNEQYEFLENSNYILFQRDTLVQFTSIPRVNAYFSYLNSQSKEKDSAARSAVKDSF